MMLHALTVCAVEDNKTMQHEGRNLPHNGQTYSCFRFFRHNTLYCFCNYFLFVDPRSTPTAAHIDKLGAINSAESVRGPQT